MIFIEATGRDSGKTCRHEQVIEVILSLSFRWTFCRQSRSSVLGGVDDSITEKDGCWIDALKSAFLPPP